jgi:hypothetical protein
MGASRAVIPDLAGASFTSPAAKKPLEMNLCRDEFEDELIICTCSVPKTLEEILP